MNICINLQLEDINTSRFFNNFLIKTKEGLDITFTREAMDELVEDWTNDKILYNLQTLIGKELTQELTYSLPMSSRVLEEDEITTLEYQNGRINIIIDKDKIITKVYPG